ncbi:MAG TPA: hypothetical protein VMM93_00450 [Vicinamibacterales bacterium]|nr:hypothetical protein [Vicinamibacterales bacterium]
MRHAAAALVLTGLVAVPVAAQVRVPPGSLPPPGSCRVWYDGVAPGRQPPPTNCRDAERVAARDRRAHVIYGRTGDDRNPYDNRYGARDPYANRYPDRRAGSYASLARDNGYRDGYLKGREDARDRDSYDPARHRWYRNGDRGYERHYGPRPFYENAYRDGFRVGYDRAYREFAGYRNDRRRGGFFLFWPF